MPFRGSFSYLEPLRAWNVDINNAHGKNLFLTSTVPRVTLPERYVALAPSAAWSNKRWPADHWSALIASLPQVSFVLLGGPEDNFCEDIARAHKNVINLAGQLNLLESCQVAEKAQAVVSADTGMLHAADQLGKACIALIGPTAFGYPWNPGCRVVEVELPCKPCSKDGRTPCVNPVYRKCMNDISPKRVKDELLSLLAGANA